MIFADSPAQLLEFFTEINRPSGTAYWGSTMVEGISEKCQPHLKNLIAIFSMWLDTGQYLNNVKGCWLRNCV